MSILYFFRDAALVLVYALLSLDLLLLLVNEVPIGWEVFYHALLKVEFKEFEPRFKSAKTRFKLSAGLNLETFDTILIGTNHI